jgi:phosphatidate cytidylyltransferase
MVPALSDFDPALGKRIVSGLVLAVLSILALVAGGIILELLVGLGVVLVTREWAVLNHDANPTEQRVIWFAVLIPAEAGVSMTFMHGPEIGLACLSLAAIASMGLMALIYGRHLNWIAAGCFYCGLPALSIIAIRDNADGASWIIWMFLIIWTTDTAAYVFGRSIGGVKLAPAISPNKTWAGLLGGISSAMAIGGILSIWLTWPWWAAALAAGFLALTAQAGDLLESHLKRRAGVKDSGSLIPGHGGVLDRVDGVMTAAPLMLLFVLAT